MANVPLCTPFIAQAGVPKPGIKISSTHLPFFSALAKTVSILLKSNLLVCFRLFIEHLAASSLSPKTIRRHVDNLWLLGGEIIRDLNYNPALRKVAAQKLLRDEVGADGGPLIYNGSEEEQRSLDSTCRKLYRFLNQPKR